MNSNQRRSKITVEDLLRVKRAERPSAEFWGRFEQELRAKQLAAIVEKRPWWHALSRSFSGLARWQLPLGATAVLAVTVFIVREYRQPAALQETGSLVAASTSAPVTIARVEPGEVLSSSVRASAATPGSSIDSSAVSGETVASNVRPGEISRVISMLDGDSRQDEAQRNPTPSARLIAANLALAQMMEPDLAAAAGNSRGFETRGLPAARPVEAEPLAEVSSPKYRTSARYLTTALPAGYVFETAASRPSEPVRSRVNGRQLRDDSISRVGVDNGGVFLKL